MFIRLVLRRKITSRFTSVLLVIHNDPSEDGRLRLFRPAAGVKEDRGDIPAGGKVVGTNTYHPRASKLPRVMIDGPFGSASDRGSPLKFSAYDPRGFAHERIPPLLMPKDIVRNETIWMHLCRGVLTR